MIRVVLAAPNTFVVEVEELAANVPALRVRFLPAPPKVLAPESTRLPIPGLVRLLAPLMTPFRASALVLKPTPGALTDTVRSPGRATVPASVMGELPRELMV